MVDFARVAASFAAELEDRGGRRVVTGCAARSLSPQGHSISVAHADGTIKAAAAICCAGAWSDRLAAACGAPAEPRIVPFRGAYLRLRPERRELVRGSIYPVPDPDLPFLGMHLTRRIDGEVLLGPSALLVGARDAYRLERVGPRDLADTLTWPGTWRLLRNHWRTAVGELGPAASHKAFVAELRRFVPELRAADVLTGPAGVRAQAVARDGSLVDDFVVHRTERAVHVRNAPSPAATASLALARLIADEAEGLIKSANRGGTLALMEAATEARVEQARTEQPCSSFAKSLFLGEIHEDLVFPWPQPDPDEQDHVRALIAAADELGSRLDPRKIEEDRWIGDDVIRELGELGLMGLYVPEEYGGQGLSQTGYARVFEAIGQVDGSLTVGSACTSRSA